MLDFKVETFLCVCKHMNFTHAANELHLTQPAVSQHIKYLEEKYNTTLFIRDKNNLTLTKSGIILKNTLETMRNDENTLIKKINACNDNKNILSFGVTVTLGQYTIIPSLINFINKHKELDIYIKYANTQTLLNELSDGTIDFAIVEGYFNPDNYQVETLKVEDFIAVTSSNHIFKNRINYLKDLKDETIIIREEGSGTRDIFTKNLAINNLTLNNFKRIIEIANTYSIVKLLTADCGIAFLYKSAVLKELNDGSLKEIKLKDFNICHELNFIWNKDSSFSNDYLKIFQEFKEYII